MVSPKSDSDQNISRIPLGQNLTSCCYRLFAIINLIINSYFVVEVYAKDVYHTCCRAVM